MGTSVQHVFFLLANMRAAAFLFFLFSPSGFFDPDPCIAPVTVQHRPSGLLSPCPSGGTFFDFFILLLLFFFSAFSPLPPPLGKSSASSKISLAFGSWSLEVGTGLLGFHGFPAPMLSCCLYLLCSFVLDFTAVKSLWSVKKMWLGLGL